ncbi:hypothetical protein LX15_004548 [Streptoalloteichus tenebrarius]|uniref:Uncharacterized protein n=1 Tax=Streptoalloteichus tenebrarius (strain ATCC 17920 / DSM 40477 / JCM 4838 / CBS 697.72 / NBRC 16177 / NCIMB 11028 / NRRL B-12390 / A12253. 1 / ISP 5477) TaxID=1933 RepID=A0ABT1HZ90_STRSD|nr:hypothetical protein [Streptoalloteichus tenebrarius]
MRDVHYKGDVSKVFARPASHIPTRRLSITATLVTCHSLLPLRRLGTA